MRINEVPVSMTTVRAVNPTAVPPTNTLSSVMLHNPLVETTGLKFKPSVPPEILEASKPPKLMTPLFGPSPTRCKSTPKTFSVMTPCAAYSLRVRFHFELVDEGKDYLMGVPT